MRKKWDVQKIFFDSANQNFEYEDKILIAKVDLLRSVVEQSGFEQFRNEFAKIEFAANVHIMFISRFLNKNARLVLTPEERKRDSKGNMRISLNLDEEIQIMDKCMAYFDTWKAWSKEQKVDDLSTKWGVKKWEELFISSVTFRNLKICVGAFFAYAKQVLSNNPDLIFVPYLHANQSTIEAVFSVLRATKRDCAQTLDKGLTAVNLNGQAKISKNCKAYSSEQVGPENVTLYNSSPHLILGPQQRESWFLQQLKKRKTPVFIDTNKWVNMFPIETLLDDSMVKVMNVIGNHEVGDTSYSTWLVNNSSFKEFAKASILGPGKVWFEDVILGGREEYVTSLCQNINLKLVRFMTESGKKRMQLKNKKAKEKIPFHLKVLHLLQDQKLGGLIDEASCASKGQRLGVAVLIQILNLRIETKLCEGLVALADKHRKNRNDVPHFRDVNTIFGYSFFNARKGIILKKRGCEEGSEQELELTKRIEFLSEMRMYAAETVLSDEYLDNCYDGFLRSANRGYMTLVKEEYFQFGKKLMEVLSALVTQEKLLNESNVTEKATNTLANNDELKKLFLDCSKNNTHLDEEGKKEMYNILVNKTANVRWADEMRAFREAYTARGSKANKSGQEFRPSLKGIGV